MGSAGLTTSPGAITRSIVQLRAGGPVVLPVEGTFVLAVTSGSVQAGKLADRVWMAADRASLETAASAAGSAASRLIRRLTPGPVIFRFASDLRNPAPGQVRAARLTSHPFTLVIITECDNGVVGMELLDARGGMVLTAADAAAAAKSLGFEVEIEGLPEPTGRAAATIVELGSTGNGSSDPAGIRIVREGAYEERFIRKQLAMNVLFVCTGNTCRSPMAEAIATALSSRGEGGAGEAIEVRFASAGTAAGSGGGASIEAVRAVKALAIGASLSGHRSRPLTRKLIAEADAIFTMGRSHLHAILDLDPEAGEKVRLLDPDGHDVPDPVGMSDRVYTQTAQSIMAMWKRRMKELGT